MKLHINYGGEGSDDASGPEEVTVEFDYRPGTPGRYSGAPERCYESEPAEVEWLRMSYYDEVAQCEVQFSPWGSAQDDVLNAVLEEMRGYDYHEECGP